MTAAATATPRATRVNPAARRATALRPARRPGVDEADPRRPGDPPWRSRTAHRTSDPAAAEALRRAREACGWSMVRAAQETGVSRPHISLLERGLRRPSGSVAEALIDGYGMTGDDADAVWAIARPHAGRDSPYRTGVIPPPDTFAGPQGNGTRDGDPHATRRAHARPDGPAGRPAPDGDAWIAWAARQAAKARGDRQPAVT